MTYEEALDENPIISRAFAEQECKRHSVSVSDMLACLGDRMEYQARDLLIWLGY